MAMEEKKNLVLIFGKDTWPYTTAAREDYGRRGYDVRYFNVQADESAFQQMLQYSGGKRSVPVIVEGDRVTIGFGGTW